MNCKSKRILSLLLVLAMLLTLMPMGFAEKAEPVYLAFTSDVHTSSNKSTEGPGYPAYASCTRLDNWLNAVSQDLGGVQFEVLGMLGDMGDYNDPNNYWKNANKVMETVDNNANVKDAVFTTGNHEIGYPGANNKSSSYYNTVWSRITRIGLAKQTASYEIYCFGANNDNQTIETADIDALETYLATAPADIPVFVLSHFPLHKDGSRDTANKAAVIELLNEHSNVIFLWGHNHTNGDSHYDRVYTETLDGTDIRFTYAAAGGMCDEEYFYGDSEKVRGKGLAVEIDGSKVSFTYYDKNFQSLGTETLEIGGSQGEAAYVKASDFEDGGKYIVVANGKAVTNIRHEGYTNNSGGYEYSGFTGIDVSVSGNKITSEIPESIVWTAEDVGSGYALKDAGGKYIEAYYNATYDGTGTKGGYIALGENAHAWNLEGTKLKNANTNKYLAWETEEDATNGIASGEVNLFSIRSSGNAEDVTLYKLSTSGGGTQEADPNAFTRVSKLEDGAMFVIAAEGFGMTCIPHSGYTNASNYSYTGFTGETLTVVNKAIAAEAVDESMIWTAEEMNGGFALKNAEGLYLAARYSGSGDHPGGDIFLSETAQAWVFSGGRLQNVSTSKYLAYENENDATGGVSSGETGLFSIRSEGNADTVTLYKAGADIKPVSFNYFCLKSGLVSGERYIITSGTHGMKDAEAVGYINGSNFSYYGFDYNSVSFNSDKSLITDGASEDMFWTITASDDGYTIQNAEGKYVVSYYQNNVGRISLSDTPEVWKLDGSKLKSASTKKYLTFDDINDATGGVKSGSVDLFTVRSSGDTLGFYRVYDNFVIRYAAGENGSVSTGREAINVKNLTPAGSVATAKPGFVFVNWTDSKGNVVSEEAKFVPTELVADTYTANFREAEPVTITYLTGDSFGSVSLDSEQVAPVSGKPLGSEAIAIPAYHFVNWTDLDGNVVSEDAKFVPGKTDGLYVAATYVAHFDKDPVCIGERPAAIGDGVYRLMIGGVDCGQFKIEYVSNSYTLYSLTENKYLGLNSSKLKYTDEMYLWSYDGGFYSFNSLKNGGKLLNLLLSLGKRYISVDDGELCAVRKATDVVLMETFVIRDHSFTCVDNGDGTHTAVCTECGAKEIQSHEFVDHECVCGACDIQKVGIASVSVNVQEKTETTRILIFFKKTTTTYTANINVIAQGVSVSTVEYRENGSAWTTGTSFSSSSAIGGLDIRVTDSNGTVSYWSFNGSSTTRVS